MINILVLEAEVNLLQSIVILQFVVQEMIQKKLSFAAPQEPD